MRRLGHAAQPAQRSAKKPIAAPRRRRRRAQPAAAAAAVQEAVAGVAPIRHVPTLVEYLQPRAQPQELFRSGTVLLLGVGLGAGAG